MKQERSFKKAFITKKGEISIKNGHPWVYFDEITSIDEIEKNGSIVDVFSPKGSYLGSGFYSEKSKIRIRILSNNANEKFDEAFWSRRVRYALDYRKLVMGEYYPYSSRLIFGESDGFPGLTVDCFNGILVTEVLSYGTETVKDIIYRALVDELNRDGYEVKGIMERNESALRDKEGLEKYSGWYECDYVSHPDSVMTTIVENGIKYNVDVLNGQKTGFFLDQKFNRLRISELCKGKDVLDCFTHTGSFAFNAAMGEAKSVTAVDISAFAIETAKENAKLNGLEERIDFVVADVFDYLDECIKNKSPKYDFIILDPPAFTKSRSTIDNASKGYKQINLQAMRMLPRGGILATCSCSHFMNDYLFRRMLLDAAKDANVSLKLIEERHQGPDHPVLMGVDETDYLKFYIFEVV